MFCILRNNWENKVQESEDKDIVVLPILFQVRKSMTANAHLPVVILPAIEFQQRAKETVVSLSIQPHLKMIDVSLHISSVERLNLQLLLT